MVQSPPPNLALSCVENGQGVIPYLDTARVASYTVEQLRLVSYSADPAHVVVLARSGMNGNGDRGHCIAIMPDGSFLVSTTEREVGADTLGPGEAVNDYESLYVIRAGFRKEGLGYKGELSHSQVRRILSKTLFGNQAAQAPGFGTGLRQLAYMTDDTVIIGGAAGFVRIPRTELMNFSSTLTGYNKWTCNGSNGEIFEFNCVRDPRNPNHLWFDGFDRFFLLDFTGTPPSAATPINTTRIAAGSNIGSAANGGWGGHLAFSSTGIWKVRMDLNDIAFWSFAQIDALPSNHTLPGSNIVPTRVLTSPAFAANNHLDFVNGRGLYGIVFDAEGGAWVNPYYYIKNSPVPIWHFSAAAMAAGGSQTPDRVINNAPGNITTMRFHSGKGLYPL